MKTTIIFIFGLLVLLSCSKDNPDDIVPGFCYGAITTLNCDCIDDIESCVKSYYDISQTEYNKLLGILNASTKPCVYVDGSEFWDNKGGYLIKLEKFVCPIITDF